MKSRQEKKTKKAATEDTPTDAKTNSKRHNPGVEPHNWDGHFASGLVFCAECGVRRFGTDKDFPIMRRGTK